MPFQMTHLWMAKKMLNSNILKPHDFLLGSIAPDSVHLRPNYSRVMKDISHLYVGDETTTNITEWTINVMKFLYNNKESDKIDFIRGYCSHILTDIRNTILIYAPFRAEFCSGFNKTITGDYLKECADIDYELYLTCEEKDTIWEMLKQSKGIDIDSLVKAVDIDKMKSHIMYVQYQNREPRALYPYKYITFERMTNFIECETEWIEKQIFDVK